MQEANKKMPPPQKYSLDEFKAKPGNNDHSDDDDFEVNDDSTDYGSDDEKRDACEAKKLRDNTEPEPKPKEEPKPEIKEEEPGN